MSTSTRNVNIFDKAPDLFEDIMVDESDRLEETREIADSVSVISHKESRRVADNTFAIWLTYFRRSSDIPSPAAKAPLTPCSDAPDLFSADFPEPEDYLEGVDDPKFQVDTAEVQLKTIQAKALCNGDPETGRPACPLLDLCLAYSINLDYEERITSSGVWGGQGETSRAKIVRRYEELRKDFRQYRIGDEDEPGYIEKGKSILGAAL